jgi:hypothetical protein
MAKKIDTAAHLKKIENLRKQFYRDIEKGFTQLRTKQF